MNEKKEEEIERVFTEHQRESKESAPVLPFQALNCTRGDRDCATKNKWRYCWLARLSWLSVVPQSEGLQVQFLVRAHAWIAVPCYPVGGVQEVTTH